MGKKTSEKSALAVSRLKEPGLHFVGGVSGLALQVIASGARSWILRVTIGGKRRDMGLGGFPDVPLAMARDKAREAREQIRKGIDPIEEVKAARSALIAARASAFTFEQAAKSFMAAHEAGWKNAKHQSQWTNTLATYAYPVIGAMLVRDITLPHILKILEPMWTTKTETAKRVRGRIEKVLDYATTKGYRNGDNPARWRGHLDNLLAKPAKLAKVKHLEALPYSDMGPFMADLRKQEGMGARALGFAILTAARSGEVRGATWKEVDLKMATWTIPAERMKAGKEHCVPLSDDAVALLNAMPKLAGCLLLFPSGKGTQLSDMTLTAVLRRMDAPAVPHGFRSSFRDWAGETTAYPREVIEHALAHQLKDKAEAAYARGTLFDKRRRLMADWARYCRTVQRKGTVTPIKGRKSA